jgi:hypothetical protein
MFFSIIQVHSCMFIRVSIEHYSFLFSKFALHVFFFLLQFHCCQVEMVLYFISLQFPTIVLCCSCRCLNKFFVILIIIMLLFCEGFSTCSHSTLKVVLLTYFILVVLQVHNSLLLCYESESILMSFILFSNGKKHVFTS